MGHKQDMGKLPIIGTFIKAFRTKVAVQSKNNLHMMEDWEIVKAGYMPAQKMGLTLMMLASIPSMLFYMAFMHYEIYDDFYREFYGTKETIYSFLLPLILYVSSFVSAKSIVKPESTKTIIYQAQRYFIYHSFADSFWLITFGNIAIASSVYLTLGSAEISPWYKTLESLPVALYLVFLIVSYAVALVFIVKIFYLHYYKLPKNYFKIEYRNEITKHELINFGTKYFFKMIGVGIVLALSINLISLLFAALKTM